MSMTLSMCSAAVDPVERLADAGVLEFVRVFFGRFVGLIFGSALHSEFRIPNPELQHIVNQ